MKVGSWRCLPFRGSKCRCFPFPRAQRGIVTCLELPLASSRCGSQDWWQVVPVLSLDRSNAGKGMKNLQNAVLSHRCLNARHISVVPAPIQVFFSPFPPSKLLEIYLFFYFAVYNRLFATSNKQIICLWNNSIHLPIHKCFTELKSFPRKCDCKTRDY